MKILIIPFILFLASCCKENEKPSIHSYCIQMESNPAFITEPFKEGYTIQFPSGFMGVGLQKSPFTSFNKEKTSGMRFYYTYNSDISSDVFFGQKLANPIPDKLESASQSLDENLALKKEFCLNDDVEAVLYYNLDTNIPSYGKLYMKHKDWYYEGLTIFFRAELLDEVEAVIKTIRKE